MIRTMQEFLETLKAALRVSTPLVAVRTPDSASTVETVLSVLNGKGDDIPVLHWDVMRGLAGLNEAGRSETRRVLDGGDPAGASVRPSDALTFGEKLGQDAILFFANGQSMGSFPSTLRGLGWLSFHEFSLFRRAWRFSLGRLASLVREDTRVTNPVGFQGAVVRYGETLYLQEDWFICHQLRGEGGKVGPDLTVEGTRGRTADWLIGHFKDPSAYTPGSIMPAFKNLTDELLKALTAFLQSQRGQQDCVGKYQTV